MSLAMRYLAQPCFVHQQTALSASRMDVYRDSLDTLAQQSHHWHSLLRRAAAWAASTARHYRRHCQRRASERADHRVESPPPKRHCRTRPSILGTRTLQVGNFGNLWLLPYTTCGSSSKGDSVTLRACGDACRVASLLFPSLAAALTAQGAPLHHQPGQRTHILCNYSLYMFRLAWRSPIAELCGIRI